MQAQGYDVTHNIVFQDNQSTMSLLVNGRASASKRSKHIRVLYFFATDSIKRGDISMEWCPTEDMWADVLTKTLNGK